MEEMHGLYHRQSELCRQLAEVAAAVVAATQAQNLAAIETINDVGRSAQLTATETRSDINRVAGSIELSQSQSEGRLGSAIERNGGDTRSAIERNGGDTRSSVERNAGEIRQNISDGDAELRRDISEAQLNLHSTIEDRTTELRLTAAHNFATTLLEIERAKFEAAKIKCDLERQASENLGAIQLKASENTAGIQLEAAKNKFDIASRMDECCCEIKETVREEGCRTRALIEKNEIDRLREALEAARRESDHHRHNESIRLSVQQVVSQNQRNAA